MSVTSRQTCEISPEHDQREEDGGLPSLGYSEIDPARGSRISHAMARRGLEYNCQLCYDLRVSESTLSRWRSGRPLSLKHAVALCKKLDISLDYLFTGATGDGSTFSLQLMELQEIFELLDGNHRRLSLGLLRSLSVRDTAHAQASANLEIGDESRLSDPWGLDINPAEG